MADWAVSPELFRIRLDALVAAHGERRVADMFGLSSGYSGVRTVRRWAADGSTPSAATQRSVARRGRAETGPAVTWRDRRGRLQWRRDPRIIRMGVVLEEREAERRQRRRAEAVTDSERAAVEAEDEVGISFDEWLDMMEDRAEDMRLREAQGEELGDGSDLYDDWADWRGEYERVAGTA